MPDIARRLKQAEGRGEGVEWIQRLARGRERLIRMEISEPSFPTPSHIVDAARQALDEGSTGYSDFQGMLELRQAVADKLQQEAGVAYDPETEVLITAGTAESNYIATQAVVDPGEEVLIADPTYLGFETYVLLAAGSPVAVPLVEENQWNLDLEALRHSLSPQTKAIMLNSPNNPTGTVFTREELSRVAEVAVDEDLWVIYDMLFDKMVYEGTAFANVASLSGMKERTLLLGGWSKVYSMCGFRVGWVAAEAETIARLTKTLHLYVSICANPVSQRAALAALRGPDRWWQTWLRSYRRRRDWAVAALNDIPGISCQQPEGGFWVFPDMRGVEGDSYKLARDLLDEVGVVTCPGVDFGSKGEGHLRIVYGHTPMEALKEGVQRIRRFAVDRVGM